MPIFFTIASQIIFKIHEKNDPKVSSPPVPLIVCKIKLMSGKRP